jgi:hypothetical protein
MMGDGQSEIEEVDNVEMHPIVQHLAIDQLLD